jgi:thiol-disulfide isomerase/thioredoxin
MHKIWIILTIFWVTASVQAQTSSSKILADRINRHLSSTTAGEYRVNYATVTVLETDTFKGAARVQYFKSNHALSDSVARFYFWENDTFMHVFDGEAYYSVLAHSKKIEIARVMDKKGIKDHITRYNAARRMSLFYPFLVNPQFRALPSSIWDNAVVVDTVWFKGRVCYDLQYQTTYPMRQRISPRDAGFCIDTRNLLIDTLSLDILRYRTHYDFGNGFPQFEESNFEHIPLSNSQQFGEHFNLDSLLNAGFQVVDYYEKNASPRVVVNVGDTIPNYIGVHTTGDTLPIFDPKLPDRFMLLDFWYRSCGPCLMAMPAIEQTYTKYKGKGVSVLGVNPVDKNLKQLQDFSVFHRVSYPSILVERAFANQVHIVGYPTLLIVDTQTRRVVFVHRGYSENLGEVLTQKIDALLRG